MKKNYEIYNEMAMNICNMIAEDVKAIFKEHNAKYLNIQSFIDNNGIADCICLSLFCADCTWVNTIFINENNEVCIVVDECEIYKQNTILVLGKDYNHLNSLTWLLEWLTKYHNHKNIKFRTAL